MTRIEHEKRVIRKMISLYCTKHHRKDRTKQQPAMCQACLELLEYASHRLDKCPKGELKSSCRKCEIHCYNPVKRASIREVMKYAGPKMILVDPLAAIKHLLTL